MPKESLYRLKNGVVASSFGSSEFYVLDMPEDAAEKWLNEFPERIGQFQKYPENWKERVDARFGRTQENAPESAKADPDNKDIIGLAKKPENARKTSNKGK